MAESTAPTFEVSEPIEVDLGGLHFSATFRAPAGATLRVSGPVDGELVEVLRFDDFVAQPHYHVPSAADATMVDPDTDGAPLDVYLDLIGGHLAELLDRAGFADLLATVDVDAVRTHIDEVRRAMVDVVPEGWVRVPGRGLQRAAGAASA